MDEESVEELLEDIIYIIKTHANVSTSQDDMVQEQISKLIEIVKECYVTPEIEANEDPELDFHEDMDIFIGD